MKLVNQVNTTICTNMFGLLRCKAKKKVWVNDFLGMMRGKWGNYFGWRWNRFLIAMSGKQKFCRFDR